MDEEEEEEALRFFKDREVAEHARHAQHMQDLDKWATQLSNDDYAQCVDRMLETTFKLRQHLHIVFVAVDIFDRFIFSTAIAKDRLRLAVAAALLIASKTEEVHRTIDIGELCDRQLKYNDVREMECLVLDRLDFCIPRPLFGYFLDHVSQLQCGDTTLFRKRLAYTAQRILVSRARLKYLPSALARIAANVVLGTADDFNVVTQGNSQFLTANNTDILTDGSEFARAFAQSEPEKINTGEV